MHKRAATGHVYRLLFTSAIILFLFYLTINFTPLFTNCDCFIESFKSEENYIGSDLSYSNATISTAYSNYTIKDNTKKSILLGIANKGNRNITIRIDITELDEKGVPGVIHSGMFTFNEQPIEIKAHDTVIIPLEYENNGFNGTAEFTVYVRNLEYTYGNPAYDYGSSSFFIIVT